MTQDYTRHGRSPLSKEHLNALDVLNKCYLDPATSEGDKKFYWAKIQQLTNSLTDTK